MNSNQLRLYLCGLPTFIMTPTLCYLLSFYNSLILNAIVYFIGYYVIVFQIIDLCCMCPYEVSFYSPFKIKYKKIKYILLNL